MTAKPKHPCIAEGCNLPVPHSQLACRDHWYELPAGLRARIWSAYRREPLGPEHVAAMLEAEDLLTLDRLGSIR